MCGRTFISALCDASAKVAKHHDDRQESAETGRLRLQHLGPAAIHADQLAKFAAGLLGAAVGCALSVATQIVVFPWFGLHPGVRENLALGGIFTAISLIRGYALRRLFEAARNQ